MSDKAFFFLGDSLIVPENVPDSEVYKEQPLELAGNFQGDVDIFKIPSLDEGGAIGVVSVPETRELPRGWRSISVRQALSVTGSAGEKQNSPLRLLRAFHITQWRLTSRFCGSCGAENIDVASRGDPVVLETQRLCPRCGREEFPRISPAVIVIITDDDNRVLLAHNNKFKQGLYSLIAGFTEPGETLEEAVEREVMEEVNLKISDVSYVKSQPWPFPNSLMLGFKARYKSGTIKCDGVEITDAAWFTKENLPEIPAHGSLSRVLIDRWAGVN